jgi:prepilin-type N-terminal cleavage/methylation domain-containing protein
MKKQQGFTLIEMIIVVLLLAVTVGMTGDILISLVRSNTKTQVINEIEQQANFVSLKLEKELRNATDASVDNGGLNLHITRREDNQEITYYLEASQLRRVVGTFGVDPYQSLTSNVSPGGVSVSCLDGPCFQILNGDSTAVRISLLFSQAQSGAGTTYGGSAKIESVITIRSTY